MSDQTWRATFWFCFAFGMMVAIVILAVYPETYRVNEKFDPPEEAPSPSSDTSSESTTVSITMPSAASGEANADQPSKEKKDVEQVTPVKKKRINIIRPFLMLRHPHVMLTSIVAAIAFGSMFAVESVLPGLFESNYNFVAWQTGKDNCVDK